MIYSGNTEKLLALPCASVYICGFLFFGVVLTSYSAISPLTLPVFCISASVVGRKLRNKTGCVCADWVVLG